MTRLKKELMKNGLVFDTMDDWKNQVYYKAENDNQQVLLFISNDFIVCGFYSMVLDPIIKVYDKQYNLIGEQNMYPDNQFLFSRDRWSSVMY